MTNEEHEKIKESIVILQYSRWEHFTREKDLLMIYLPQDPKVVKVQKALNELIEEIKTLQNKLK